MSGQYQDLGVRPCGARQGIGKGGSGAVRLPKILVLTCVPRRRQVAPHIHVAILVTTEQHPDDVAAGPEAVCHVVAWAPEFWGLLKSLSAPGKERARTFY